MLHTSHSTGGTANTALPPCCSDTTVTTELSCTVEAQTRTITAQPSCPLARRNKEGTASCSKTPVTRAHCSTPRGTAHNPVHCIACNRANKTTPRASTLLPPNRCTEHRALHCTLPAAGTRPPRCPAPNGATSKQLPLAHATLQPSSDNDPTTNIQFHGTTKFRKHHDDNNFKTNQPIFFQQNEKKHKESGDNSFYNS